MPQLLGSKVINQEEAPQTLNVPFLPTAVAGAIMVTQMGPIGVATRCTSFEDYQKVFGTHHAASDSAAYVKGFFDNGGTELWIVRTVHFTDNTNPATKASAQASLTLQTANVAAQSGFVDGTIAGPYAMTSGDTLGVKVDGAGTTNATFTAAAATRTSGNAAPFGLANNDTLTLQVNGGSTQTVTFTTSQFANIAAATAAEVAASINGQIIGASATVSGSNVVITSDRKGTSAGINITGGTANAVGKLNYTTGLTSGTGNVANILAVTATEVKTVVEAAVAGVTVSTNGASSVRITRNTTGAAASVQVDVACTLDTVIGLDNAVHQGANSGVLSTLQVKGKYDGTYPNTYKVKISAASSGDADAFNFDLLDATGIILETFANLSMTNSAGRFVETIINASPDAGGSRLVAVTDLAAATTSPNDLPATGTFGPLAGGNDGLSGLVDADYIGASSSSGKTGIRALDLVEELTLLLVPGQATSAIHNAMLTYCEVTRALQPFAVLDPPASQSETQIVTYVTTTAGLKGLSECGGFYWPRIKVSNPSTAIYGTVDRIPLAPSAHVAGMLSRVDNARPGGVYDPPAGVDVGRLFGVLELEKKVISGGPETDLVFPKLINPIATLSGLIFVDGARCLKDSGNWPYVSQRRGASFIERSLQLAIQPKRHKNNTPELRAALTRGANDFLTQQLRNKAFKSDIPAEAFFVDYGDALNPDSTPNVVTGRYGLAFAAPAEFIINKFSKKLS
jgi:phage tail sheath protein FI